MLRYSLGPMTTGEGQGPVRRADGEASPLRRRAARWLRKHRFFLALCALFLVLLFGPTLFFARVLSPNDVYYNHDPWRTVREVESQNPLLNDPPSSWYTLWSLLRDDPSSFHWNRYVGGGIPGWGSAGAAVLSPVVAIPVLLVPLLWSYTAIVVFKFLVAAVFGYLWLREERLGRRGAAVGAIVIASAGVVSVWWLWQATNATVLYPAVLWAVSRIFRGKRNSFGALLLLALSMALAGYPATMAYGAWMAVAWSAFLAVARRRIPVAGLGKAALAAILALGIALPSLAPYASFLRRTGYLEARETAAATITYPVEHLRAFVRPHALGDPAARLWIGDPALGIANNFVEATLYLGLFTLPLALLGVFSGRRGRWFWLAFAALVIAAAFGAPFLRGLSHLPGIEYSPATRLRFLLPPAAGWLAGAGVSMLTRLGRAAARKRPPAFREAAARVMAIAAGIAVVADLALFAARFYPWISPRVAAIPVTDTIRFLRSQPGPARIAPFFDYLWPNTAELMRVEDVRSHFGSEARYRALLSRIAPGAFGGSGTVIQLNALQFDYRDPLLSALNVEWLIEQPSIDVTRWKILEGSRVSDPLAGHLVLSPAAPRERLVPVEASMPAIDLNLEDVKATGPDAGATVTLIRPETGKAVWQRTFRPAELTAFPKTYVPIAPFASEGNALLLKVAARDMTAKMPRGEDGRLVYGKAATPIVLHSVLREGRIFRNVNALGRFYGVWRARCMPFEAMLEDRGIDFLREAVFTADAPDLGPIAAVPPERRRATISVRAWTGTRAVVETESEVPFLLASSEKRTPELRVLVDGEARPSWEVQGLFAAVPIPAGRHTVVFERRLGRGTWIPAAGAALLGLILSGMDRRRRGPGAAR